jgi:hypothetical protein
MRRPLLLAAAIVLSGLPLHADDGAASIAAGGIILMKRESRIIMANEVLQISPTKVTVDYDFRNDSDNDIATEIAFPIPAYKFGDSEEIFGDPGFDDFKLIVDGKPTRYSAEIRAFVGKRDITALLTREHIDIPSFAHWDTKTHDFASPGKDFQNTSPVSKHRLIASGAFGQDGTANWRVAKKYHWTQTFPAHQIVHIQHSYSPVLGNSNTIGDPAIYQGKDAVPEYAESCPSPALRNTLSATWNKSDRKDISPLSISYVNFILTTANTWKTPIEDFTLIVQRPHETKYKTYVSFCWGGSITKPDADHFVAHVKGLLPTKELMIGYIDVHSEVK